MTPTGRILIVTNDFSPNSGGIETFTSEMVKRWTPSEVVVYTSDADGATEHDRRLPYTVVRDEARTLLPNPRTARSVRRAMLEHRCDRVWFAAAAPLALLAPTLRKAGAQRIVATSHGHETWWARLAPSRWLLRAIADSVDSFTYISEHTASVLEPVVKNRSNFVKLAPGVNVSQFYRCDRQRPKRPRVIVCVARLIKRKGQDSIINAMPAVIARYPGTQLILVGDGPHRRALERRARSLGVREAVVFLGAIPHDDVASALAGADIFAMPSRSRRFGLEEEGLGIAYLEAAAAGLPVIVGTSGGAPETIVNDVTGMIVDNDAQLEYALLGLLGTPSAVHEMGEAGMRWAQQWSWDATWFTLDSLLHPPKD